MSPAARAEFDGTKLRVQLEPVVSELGYDLEEVVVQRAGSRRLLRVVVDADGGISLDDIAEVSQAVSAALDEGEQMGEHAYDLEVTSPGVSRPLTEPRHWRRAAGRLVQATLTAGGEITGRVVEADDEGVTLELPGKKPGQPGERRRLGYSELGKGRVQIEFNRPGADGDQALDDEADEDVDVDEQN
ncbi:ribosome maturation factor RimP [Actinospica durhamensis]|uniref:Ribosome maturation factor RimP n=1 Tax=Actinospica durhamensis TaxID=1508375 RepID=A0A941ETT7_9ACTN|nr:ribosome maturation factor RimP [Actinospica durhamensis]MBR7833749.1 ribosome maturation factor RimP [Actinospica durhamensis]